MYNLEVGDSLTPLLIAHKNSIRQNWINCIKKNCAIENKVTIKFLNKSIEKILEIFINKGLFKDLENDTSIFISIANEMAYKDISYYEFMEALQYFQESYMNIVIKDIKCEDIKQHLFLINKLYNYAITHIAEEYFNVKDTTVFALVKLAELRDDTTGDHLEKTSEYTILLSKELGFSNDFIRKIERASLLHDIGKVGIRDSILLKQSRLTDEEFEEMKQHTIIGAETIDQIIKNDENPKEYLMMARDITLYHHEKYDGSGYPYGLKGEEIPLVARIFALADAYDVIVSKRPYKEPLSHDEALERIKRDSNKHFDPKIVEVFMRNNEKFNRINIKHKEGSEF